MLTKLLALNARGSAVPAAPGDFVYYGRRWPDGSGDGQFDRAYGLALNAAASRLYVVDSYNYRVQYFRDTTSGVAPASLGKVKAVFR